MLLKKLIEVIGTGRGSKVGGTECGFEAGGRWQGLAEQPAANWLLNEEDLQPGPCVGTPEKLNCIGLNYNRHAWETGMAVPDVPVLFSKFNNTLTRFHDICCHVGAVVYIVAGRLHCRLNPCLTK